MLNPQVTRQGRAWGNNMGGSVRIGLLGPVEVWCGDDRPVDAGGPRQRTVLAALAVDVGRLVPVTTLIDRVWGAEAPAQSRHAVHVYASRIRKLIDRASSGPRDGALLSRAGSYVLDLPPGRVDLARFRSLVAGAATAGNPSAPLRQALDLWRGEPLAGLPGEWAARCRDAWQRQRADAVLGWAEAELARGNARAIVNDLTDLAVDYPLDEPILAMMIRALHTAGRGAEALDRYGRVRRRFAEELGVDPGRELQRLHHRILR